MYNLALDRMENIEVDEKSSYIDKIWMVMSILKIL
jgi:hypothetical protein